MPFIDENGLKKLDEYKYISGGYSWLDNKMNPFWIWFVDTLIPQWLAPNLMTGIGLIFMVLGYLIMLIYDFSLTEDVPSWTYFFAGLCLFLYQTFDACDGKQARKTKSSSPLGQLIDHGCDSFAINFMFLSVIQAVNIPRILILIVYMNMQFVFWTSQWYEYHTKILRTNVYNMGVTEAQFVLIALNFTTGVFGRTIWGVQTRNAFPNFVVEYIETINNGKIFLDSPLYQYIYVALNIGMVIVSFAMIIDTMIVKKKISSILQFIPVILVLILEIMIYNVTILNEKYLGLVLISYGVLYSLFCCKIIICSMTDTVFPLFHTESIIPIITTIYLLFNNSKLDNNTIIILFSLNIASIVLGSIGFLYGVVTQITNHLGIYCFSLKKVKNN